MFTIVLTVFVLKTEAGLNVIFTVLQNTAWTETNKAGDKT
jgi:hypothetical protein